MGSSAAPHARRKALADAITGVIASLAALWVFYPLDVYKTRLQSGHSRQDQWSAGLGLKSLHTASSSFTYFYLYSWIVAQYTSGNRRLSPSSRLVLSALAAMLNTCLTLPLDVLSAQSQTALSTTPTMNLSDDEGEEEVTEESRVEEEEPIQKPLDTKKHKRRFQQVADLWKGLSPSLILCTNPAIHYTVFDTIKYRYLDRCQRRSLNMPEAFVLGLAAKFAATMATYPLIRAKILLMVTDRRSLFGCLLEEYQKNGSTALYRGCSWQLLHTMLKSALLMMVREKITRATRRLVLSEA